MTREKAYEIIDKHPLCTECDGSFPYTCDECGEAFLTAFDALKQPKIVRCKDCLYRDTEFCPIGRATDDFFCGCAEPKGR